MGDDRNDVGHHLPSTVPIDSIPAPVIGYDVTDEGPAIAVINGPFEAAFGPVPAGTAVRSWLRDEVGVTGTRVDDVCSSLAEGRSIDIELGGRSTNGTASEPGRYRFRTFEGVGSDEGGYVLLTESPSRDADGVETDRIASVISHDLRNPLDVANAHLRAARETGEKEHFDEVRQSHDRMEQIIQDVLTLARGKSALSITAGVDIESVASDAWASVETRGASLTLEDDLSTTEADTDRLQRLFENLFRNSVEHAHPPATDDAANANADRSHETTPDRGLRVRVGSTDGGFFVADNGPGVPPEDRSRVFDPGYSRNETGGGTGLGLTIVEEIAEAHDWTVSLTNGSLGGARFEFRPLPRTDREGDDPET
jgi:signal transduction histidine kinase